MGIVSSTLNIIRDMARQERENARRTPLQVSTERLWAEFELEQTPQQALDIMLEEVRELVDAVQQGESDARIAEELTDVRVTLFGVLHACGIDDYIVENAEWTVIAKNGGKTQDTHYKALDGKIRKRPGNSINVWL